MKEHYTQKNTFKEPSCYLTTAIGLRTNKQGKVTYLSTVYSVNENDNSSDVFKFIHICCCCCDTQLRLNCNGLIFHLLVPVYGYQAASFCMPSSLSSHIDGNFPSLLHLK